MTTTTYTAAEYLAAYEPHTLALMRDCTDDLEGDLQGDTRKADKMARRAGLEVPRDGRYPAVVWLALWP